MNNVAKYNRIISWITLLSRQVQPMACRSYAAWLNSQYSHPLQHHGSGFAPLSGLARPQMLSNDQTSAMTKHQCAIDIVWAEIRTQG